ncbi:unnamed protein product [Triticum aestivum]|uniref:RING-type domain-containing protein n=1 Tax=Triticum aestivum TaxID=4565 RepID=A0A7H4LI34_WHEAT|nr:unnamed protein product [Triticum aestivum]
MPRRRVTPSSWTSKPRWRVLGTTRCSAISREASSHATTTTDSRRGSGRAWPGTSRRDSPTLPGSACFCSRRRRCTDSCCLAMRRAGRSAPARPPPAGGWPMPRASTRCSTTRAWRWTRSSGSRYARAPPVLRDWSRFVDRFGRTVSHLLSTSVVQTERIRAGLEEARRRHARAALATVERAAAGRLQAVEAELERARYRNGELEEWLRQMTAEGQAWLGVAKSHEAVAAGLRTTLDQLLQPPCAVAGTAEGDADDAQSCCFETPAGDNADDAASKAVAAAPSCKACGQADACVLLLPCRHLSLCGACEPSVDTCPVCAATKNASLHVLLS